MRVLTPLICAAAVLAPALAPAQSPFSAAITVENQAITYYEIDQRAQLLTVFRTPGDTAEIARQQLVDDKLRAMILERAGLALTSEGLSKALEDFAARANRPYDEFVAALAEEGVSEAALRDYVRVNATWRDYINRTYGSQITITEADIDRALADLAEGSASLEVLLSEIVIPAPQERAERVAEVADQISQLTTIEEFSDAARQVSAVASREEGGFVDWQPIADFPPALSELLATMQVGEVTAPLPLQGAVALLQMRGLREVRGAAVASDYDYATLLIPGAATGSAQARATQIAPGNPTCDTLYTVARDYPVGSLTRDTGTAATIEADIAMELRRLDPGEMSTTLTRNGGNDLLLVMLCSRAPSEGPSRDDIRAALRGQALADFATVELEQARSQYVITEQ